MLDHVAYVFIMAFAAHGAYAAMQDGMILAALGRLLSRLPLWLHKPTHTCSVCMVSGWGVPVLLYVAWVTGASVDPFMVPVYILAAAGLNWGTA